MGGLQCETSVRCLPCFEGADGGLVALVVFGLAGNEGVADGAGGFPGDEG